MAIALPNTITSCRFSGLVQWQLSGGRLAWSKAVAKAGSTEARGVKVETPISSPSGFPRIELQIGGATHGFLLDTGASFTMISRTVLEACRKTLCAQLFLRIE